MKKLNYVNFKDALEKSLNLATTIERFEYINLEDSFQRIVFEDIISVKNIPSFNNSAMDGFGFTINNLGKKLKIKKVVFAGDCNVGFIDNNECVKIMTGAKVPDGVDAIVPVENMLNFDNEFAIFPNEAKKGSNLRFKGEEIKKDSLLIKKGTQIDSSIIALLAAQGITKIKVYTRLKIAVLSTGNELIEPWEDTSEDHIYNSNASAIISLLKEHNFHANYIGVVPDSLDKSMEFIGKLKPYDVIITSGGISMGDADYVAQAFLENGLNIEFHGVNVKPGKPTMMGKMGETTVIALPGNPLTALVNTYLLALPLIYRLSGAKNYYHDFIYAKNKKDFKLSKNRANLILGDMKNGQFQAIDDNKYGSGMITPLVKSNSIVVVLGNKEVIKEGELLKVILTGVKLKEFQSDIYN